MPASVATSFAQPHIIKAMPHIIMAAATAMRNFIFSALRSRFYLILFAMAEEYAAYEEEEAKQQAAASNFLDEFPE